MASSESKTIGLMMKEARNKRGLTQVQVAELVERNQPTVSEWELGLRTVPLIEFITWANALDLTRAEWASFRELGMREAV